MIASLRNWLPGSRQRLTSLVDSVRASFGALSALALALGLIAGLGLPEIDGWLQAKVPLFDFSTQEAARSMLETIATVMVSVAGIAFSVTIVAFTLATNQLSPRVLRSFRRDLVSQLTLAAFLGTFVYCLALLARLGSIGSLGDQVPSISIAIAVLLALASLALFAVFVGHIATMLQPSSVINSIAADARPELERPFPAGVGGEPEDPEASQEVAERRMREAPGSAVECASEGYLVGVRGAEILAAACEARGLVRQRCQIGDYLLPGQELAVAWAPEKREAEALAARVAGCFETGRQRTLPQDPGFPIRQLADVALKGLSPGINDPTTAINAMEAITAGLIRLARSERPSPVRLDGDAEPRFIADAPEFDQLVVLGFEQALAFAGDDPLVWRRLHELLRTVVEAAPAPGPHSRIRLLLASA
ncbi:MAG: DUF2254 domain-containing protein [Solirubrobacterales bacterium]